MLKPLKNHRWQWCLGEITLPSHRYEKMTIVEVYFSFSLFSLGHPLNSQCLRRFWILFTMEIEVSDQIIFKLFLVFVFQSRQLLIFDDMKSWLVLNLCTFYRNGGCIWGKMLEPTKWLLFKLEDSWHWFTPIGSITHTLLPLEIDRCLREGVKKIHFMWSFSK